MFSSVDKTYKMFYGGGQKRPDSGASRPVLRADGSVLSYVPDAGKKDVRNAVEAALKAAGGEMDISQFRIYKKNVLQAIKIVLSFYKISKN